MLQEPEHVHGGYTWLEWSAMMYELRTIPPQPDETMQELADRLRAAVARSLADECWGPVERYAVREAMLAVGVWMWPTPKTTPPAGTHPPAADGRKEPRTASRRLKR